MTDNDPAKAKTDDETETADLARPLSPVTPELRARMKALAAEGVGRNAIAREVGVDGATVSKYAKRDGYHFDREQTAMAVRARQIDLQAIRTDLARKFLLAADDALEALATPVKLGAFGGKDNTWNETLLDTPTIEARSVLVKTAQAASTQGIALLRQDAEAGSSVARSMVEQLRDALTKGLAAMETDGVLVDPTVTPDSQPSTPAAEQPEPTE